MTELSPAQKALAAFNERHELCGPFDDDWVEQCLAAAIQSIAVVLRNAYANEEYVDPADDWLDDIAAELRGTTTTKTP
jgi:hypothetical protein